MTSSCVSSFLYATLRHEDSSQSRILDVEGRNRCVHVRKVACGGNHGERAEELTTNDEGEAFRNDILSTSIAMQRLERSGLTENNESGRIFVSSVFLGQIGVFEDVLDDSQEMSDMVSGAVAEEKGCIATSISPLGDDTTGERGRTVDGELGGIPHARDEEFEQVEERPAREVEPEHGRVQRGPDPVPRCPAPRAGAPNELRQQTRIRERQHDPHAPERPKHKGDRADVVRRRRKRRERVFDPRRFRFVGWSDGGRRRALSRGCATSSAHRGEKERGARTEKSLIANGDKRKTDSFCSLDSAESRSSFRITLYAFIAAFKVCSNVGQCEGEDDKEGMRN